MNVVALSPANRNSQLIAKLLAEARSAAHSHVDGTIAAARSLADDLRDVQDMGDAVPVGVRDEALRLVMQIQAAADRIQSIMGRAA